MTTTRVNCPKFKARNVKLTNLRIVTRVRSFLDNGADALEQSLHPCDLVLRRRGRGEGVGVVNPVGRANEAGFTNDAGVDDEAGVDEEACDTYEVCTLAGLYVLSTMATCKDVFDVDTG